MASNYTPVGGTFQVVDGYNVIKQVPLPSGQVSFPHGCPMYLNATGQAVPCLCSINGTGGAISTTNALASGNAQGLFMASFIGLAAEARFPQQEMVLTSYSAPGGSTPAMQDASKPYISIYDDAIAQAPYYDGVNTTVQNVLPVGTFVGVTPFLNEATYGIYTASGTFVASTGYFLYMNSVCPCTVASGAIGVVTKQANVGDAFVEFKFKSAALNPANFV